ncbi:hypothetical protein EYF80_052644 [Liparis tanakae]|uniref:Uncharacterized protein n=1 Tax=Liparis tanakae TaxID=230148 RepID=A0A4Z2F8S3_9TELE|nr:hypothetical protein EYF80_052644 [Liparis tanakae]
MTGLDCRVWYWVARQGLPIPRGRDKLTFGVHRVTWASSPYLRNKLNARMNCPPITIYLSHISPFEDFVVVWGHKRIKLVRKSKVATHRCVVGYS